MALSLYVGAVAAGTTASAPSYPTSTNTIPAGAEIYLAIVNKAQTVTPTAPSGWTAVPNGTGTGGVGTAGADSGQVRVSLFRKNALATGSESGSVSVGGLGSAGSTQAVIFGVSYASGKLLQAVANVGADNTAGTGFSVTCGSNIGLTAGDLLVVVAGTNTDAATYASENTTASGVTAWGTLTEHVDAQTANGNDQSIVLCSRPVTTGTSTAAPVFTMTASSSTSNQNAGAAIFIRFREVDITPLTIYSDAAWTRWWGPTNDASEAPTHTWVEMVSGGGGNLQDDYSSQRLVQSTTPSGFLAWEANGPNAAFTGGITSSSSAGRSAVIGCIVYLPPAGTTGVGPGDFTNVFEISIPDNDIGAVLQISFDGASGYYVALIVNESSEVDNESLPNLTAAGWHYILITYDSNSGDYALRIDGTQVGTGSSLDNGFNLTTIFAGYLG